MESAQQPSIGLRIDDFCAAHRAAHRFVAKSHS
jgi:hypothetical protein